MGIVTAGCAAAMTHVTTTCLVGTDPERMQQLPNLHGLKSEVVIPNYSRNVYDHAIRMLGVKIVEISDPAQLEAAFNERTSLAYVLAGPGDEGPLGTKVVAGIARRKGVPLLVDAAAEDLTIPNIHLQPGATVVTYSGGKILRGPECAGVAIDDKNLLQAAWANTWQSWLDTITNRMTKIGGISTRIEMPDSLSNNAPTRVIEWDGTKLGITGGGSEQAPVRYRTSHYSGGVAGQPAALDGKLRSSDAVHDDSGRR